MLKIEKIPELSLAIRDQIKMKNHFSGHFRQFYSHQIIAYQILASIGQPKSVIKLNLFVRKTIQILSAKKSKHIKLH